MLATARREARSRRLPEQKLESAIVSNSVPRVSEDLKNAYEEQYRYEDAKWRELGAVRKASNILRLCKGREFSKVLECGAGEGSILQALNDSEAFDELFAIEISHSGIERIQARSLVHLTEVTQFDGYTIPYGDQEFDLVYCSHVLEHVELPRLLLRELRRISKHQIFEVPLDYGLDLESHTPTLMSYGHINVYTPSLFRHLLATEGFCVIEDHLSHTDIEVTRYNWYINLGIRRSLWREAQLRAKPALRGLRKMFTSRSEFKELGYDAYTCLTQAAAAPDSGSCSK